MTKPKLFADIVLAEGNEEEFLAMAERLGYQQLFFAAKDQASYERAAKLAEKSDPLKIHTGIVSMGGAKLKPAAARVLWCTSADMRNLFENNREALIVPQCRLDQVACAAAARNRNAVCFSLREVLHGNPGNTPWNITLCRKYHVQSAIASFARSPFEMRGAEDVASLFTCLGMEPGTARKSLQYLAEGNP